VWLIVATVVLCVVMLGAAAGYVATHGTRGLAHGTGPGGVPEGFVPLRDVVTTVAEEIRYAGYHNFVGRPINGYDAPVCWVTVQAAEALRRADELAASLQPPSVLKVYDCYRSGAFSNLWFFFVLFCFFVFFCSFFYRETRWIIDTKGFDEILTTQIPTLAHKQTHTNKHINTHTNTQHKKKKKKKKLHCIALDCNNPRPMRAVSDFVAWGHNTTDDIMKEEFYPALAKSALFPTYIATRSGHSRGSTVDLTLMPVGAPSEPRFEPGVTKLVPCTAPVGKRWADNSVAMPTGFDCFSAQSWTNSTVAAITAAERRNRATLVELMQKSGFVNLPEEWWHFTLKDEPFPDTYFDFPVIQPPPK
jgi:D-alanyl-D-alanine dipeptidase